MDLRQTACVPAIAERCGLTTSCTVGRGSALRWLVELGMMGAGARELIVAEYRVTRLSQNVIAELIAEVGPLWHEEHRGRLAARPRRRAVGAGAKNTFVFVDRLLATLVSLCHGTTHDVLACWFGVDRSTITPAIGEVRPLLAQRRCTIAPGIRMRTLAEVDEYLGTGGRTGIIDGTEIRVRRPAAGRKDRDRFIFGKTKQNAVKAMVLTDTEGRVLFCSPVRPGSCADITRPDSSASSSSWWTVLSWRSLRMPAIRAWVRRPADGW
ncbi:transposase [Streptomyces canus]